MDEREAVERLKQGDLAGMEHLVRYHQVRAARAAYLITRDQALAADVVQQAFLRAVECISQFDDSRPFGPWFLRIVTNAALKTAVKATREVSLEDEWDAGERVEDAPPRQRIVSADLRASENQREPESQVEDGEQRRALWDALGRLSPEDRAALVQRYFLELSEAEMAREMQVAVGTVKWRLHQTRKRLRRQMERGKG